MAKMSLSELHKDDSTHFFRLFRLVIRIYDHALLALGDTRRASLERESIVSAERGIDWVQRYLPPCSPSLPSWGER